MSETSQTREAGRMAPSDRDETDFDHEPVNGLPGAPPAGERILWQGSPCWRALAWRAFGVRLAVLYFATVAVWRTVALWSEGAGVEAMAEGLLKLAPFVVGVLAILGLIAWVSARATVYTLTSKRLAMRIGVVTTVTINLPYRWIGSASLAKHRDGVGDIALALAGRDRLSYLLLWPHARPWHLRKAQPALRAIRDAGTVAEVLARALRADQVARAGNADETCSPETAGTGPGPATEVRDVRQSAGGRAAGPGLIPAE